MSDEAKAEEVAGRRWLWEVPEGAKSLGPVVNTSNLWEQLWERVQRPWSGLDVAVHLGGQVTRLCSSGWERGSVDVGARVYFIGVEGVCVRE